MIQILKLLLFIMFIYALFNLVRFIIRLGRVADARRKQENINKNAPGPKQREGVIELEKDQYKVE